MVVVMVWECEGGEGWTMEVAGGTEKRTVESYLCEKVVEDGNG